MRTVSDALCREYGLSLIKPVRRGMPYAAWQAEKEGKPNRRKALREDIDRILANENAHGLCAPLEPGWEQNITQHFGGMYSGSPHKGMDIGMPEGTPVYAAADGKVTVANASDSWGYSWGYYVKINHAEGVDTLYAHLSSVAVSYGQYVHQGDVIGYVGSTGNSSGNHLHFELYLENNRVDPYPYIGTDLLSKYLERTF